MKRGVEGNGKGNEVEIERSCVFGKDFNKFRQRKSSKSDLVHQRISADPYGRTFLAASLTSMSYLAGSSMFGKRDVDQNRS